MVEVFHAGPKAFSKVMLGNVQEVTAAFKAGQYEKVAEVNTDDMEKAFELTNHIDSDWTKNADVTPLTTKNRSTSVGDVMVMNGEHYLVGMLGFVKIAVN